MEPAGHTVGDLLRDWRQRRRLSQLALANQAEISSRHLSFIETGRSQPSREMVLHLAEELAIPIRERNVLLVAAGSAPVFAQRSLSDPALAAARSAIELVLEAQKPYPAFAIDRHWVIVASNGALPEMFAGVLPELLEPPINALRLSLHPQGLAPRVVNFHEWRGHLLALAHQRGDPTGGPSVAGRCGGGSGLTVPRQHRGDQGCRKPTPLLHAGKSCPPRRAGLHPPPPPRFRKPRPTSLCKSGRGNFSSRRMQNPPRSCTASPAKPPARHAERS